LLNLAKEARLRHAFRRSDRASAPYYETKIIFTLA